MDSSAGRLETRMETTRLPGSLRRWFFRLLLITSFFGASGSWAADPKMRFDLRSDEFPKAILEYSHQSNVEVLFLANDSLHKVRTQPVSGEFSPQEALQKMLKGSGLIFDFDTDHSVTIKEPPQVTSAPPAISTAPKALQSAVQHLASAEPVVRYQSDISEVTVTGTYLHTAMESPVPLIYLTQSDFSRAPFPTVQDVLNQLPITSLNAPREDLFINNNYNWGTGVNLRGLGVAATLVLVDGRRQPLSGLDGDFVDVSNIPAAAVERIEILPDGASALYGSDAIAGVVNIIMKDHFEGAETQVRYGGAAGGRDEVMVSQLLGTKWDTGRAMLVYEYLDGTELAASTRGYAANADKTPYGGGDYRSYFTYPGNVLNPNTQQPLYGLPVNLNAASINTSAPINLENQFSQYQIFPQVTSNSVYARASQQAGSSVELFAEGRITRRSTDVLHFPKTDTLEVPSTNPFNPFGTNVAVAYDFGHLFGPTAFGADTTNYVGTVGANFKLGAGWKATLSETYGRETLFSSTYNVVSSGALTTALGKTSVTTAFDPFGGGTTPATLAGIESDAIFHAVSAIETTSFVADGPVFDLPAGSVQLALGSERREESLDRTLETTVGRYSRHVGSAFTELSVPLIGDASKPHAPPRLELNAAARYDDYTDFGHTVDPEFRLRWVPLEWLKLRGSWGRSYRAPTLDDLYDPSNNASGLLVLNDPMSPTGRSTVLAIQGNNPNLKQETATTWTAGLDLVPVVDPGLKLSMTYYAIDYEGQITTPDAANPSDILLQGQQWAAFITRNPTQTQVAAVCNRPDYLGNRAQCLASSSAAIVDIRLANVASTKVTGLDLDVRQTLDSAVGHFDFGFNGSYVFHFDQAATNSAPSVDIVNTFGNPLKFHFRTTAGWSQHREEDAGLGANVAVNFTNGYSNPESARLPRVASLATVDTQLRYHTADDAGPWGGLDLSLNAVNVFNRSPPFADNLYGYDTANFQGLGRVISLSVRKKW